jgi:hypothetical protein
LTGTKSRIFGLSVNDEEKKQVYKIDTWSFFSIDWAFSRGSCMKLLPIASQTLRSDLKI